MTGLVAIELCAAAIRVGHLERQWTHWRLVKLDARGHRYKHARMFNSATVNALIAAGTAERVGNVVRAK